MGRVLNINNIASLRAAIAEGLIYLNVHSEAQPPGIVRGQLLPGQASFPGVIASVDRLVSATVGLNYVGQGHCIVVNGGMTAADVTISIVDADTSAVLATAVATIPAGTSFTLPYQALTANRQDAFCEATKGTPGAEIRMVFKRVFFNGDGLRRFGWLADRRGWRLEPR